MVYNEEVQMMMSVVPGTMTGISTMMSGLVSINNVFLDMTRQLDASFGLIDTSIITASTIIAQFGLGAAEAFGQFEQGLKVAQMVSGQTAQDMDYLRQKANEFSVSYRTDIDQITEGLQTLGRAGLNSAAEQTEVLQSGLSTAKLEGRDLNGVLEELIQNTALLGGNLKSSDFGEDSKYVNDLLVATSMTAPITTHDVSETLKYSGGIAAAAGANIESEEGKAILEDYMGAIAAFAQKGVTGSIAGTALRAFFNKPATQDSSVKDALSSIKLKPEYLWEDDEKTMKPVSEQIALIKNQMDELNISTMDQLQIWSKIVGGKMGQQMMKLDSDSIKELTKDIQSANDAESLAAGTFETYQMKMKQMTEQGQVAFRQFGEYAAKYITPFLDLITRILEILSNPVVSFMGFVAGIELLFAGVRRIKNVFSEIRKEFATIKEYFLRGDELYTIRPSIIRSFNRRGDKKSRMERAYEYESKNPRYGIGHNALNEYRKEKEMFLISQGATPEDLGAIERLSGKSLIQQMGTTPLEKRKYQGISSFLNKHKTQLGLEGLSLKDIALYGLRNDIWTAEDTRYLLNPENPHSTEDFLRERGETITSIIDHMRNSVMSGGDNKPSLSDYKDSKGIVATKQLLELFNIKKDDINSAKAIFQKKFVEWEIDLQDGLQLNFSHMSELYRALNESGIFVSPNFLQNYQSTFKTSQTGKINQKIRQGLPNTAAAISPYIPITDKAFFKKLTKDFKIFDPDMTFEQFQDMMSEFGHGTQIDRVQLFADRLSQSSLDLKKKFIQATNMGEFMESIYPASKLNYPDSSGKKTTRKNWQESLDTLGIEQDDFLMIKEALLVKLDLMSDEVRDYFEKVRKIDKEQEALRGSVPGYEKGDVMKPKPTYFTTEFSKDGLTLSDIRKYVEGLRDETNALILVENELKKQEKKFNEVKEFSRASAKHGVLTGRTGHDEELGVSPEQFSSFVFKDAPGGDIEIPYEESLYYMGSDSLPQIDYFKNISLGEERGTVEQYILKLTKNKEKAHQVLNAMYDMYISGLEENRKLVNEATDKYLGFLEDSINVDTLTRKEETFQRLGSKKYLPEVFQIFGKKPGDLSNGEMAKELGVIVPKDITMDTLKSLDTNYIKDDSVNINALRTAASLIGIGGGGKREELQQKLLLANKYSEIFLAGYGDILLGIVNEVFKDVKSVEEEVDNVYSNVRGMIAHADAATHEVKKRIAQNETKKDLNSVMNKVADELPSDVKKKIPPITNPYDEIDLSKASLVDYEGIGILMALQNNTRYGQDLVAASKLTPTETTDELRRGIDELYEREFEKRTGRRTETSPSILYGPKSYKEEITPFKKGDDPFYDGLVAMATNTPPEAKKKKGPGLMERIKQTLFTVGSDGILGTAGDYKNLTGRQKIGNLLSNLTNMAGGKLLVAIEAATFAINMWQEWYKNYTEDLKKSITDVKEAYSDRDQAESSIRQTIRNQNEDITDEEVDAKVYKIYGKLYDNLVNNHNKYAKIASRGASTMDELEYDEEKDDGSYKKKEVKEEEVDKEQENKEALKQNTAALYAATSQLNLALSKLQGKMTDNWWGLDGWTGEISTDFRKFTDSFSNGGVGPSFLSNNGNFLLTAQQQDENYSGYTEMAGLMLEDFKDSKGDLRKGLKTMMGVDADFTSNILREDGKTWMENMAKFSSEKSGGLSAAQNARLQSSMKYDQKSWNKLAKDIAKFESKHKKTYGEKDKLTTKKIENQIKKLQSTLGAGFDRTRVIQAAQLEIAQGMYSVAQTVFIPLIQQNTISAAETVTGIQGVGDTTAGTGKNTYNTAAIASSIASMLGTIALAQAGDAARTQAMLGGDVDGDGTPNTATDKHIAKLALDSENGDDFLRKSLKESQGNADLIGLGQWMQDLGEGASHKGIGSIWSGVGSAIEGAGKSFGGDRRTADYLARVYGISTYMSVYGLDAEAAKKKYDDWYNKEGKNASPTDILLTLGKNWQYQGFVDQIQEGYLNSGDEGEGAGSGGGGSGSGNKGDNTGSRKERVDLVLCSKKEIPKLNVNLFKKPPTFTVLNKNFKVRDVKINTEDTPKAIMSAIKNSFIDVQKRSDPKIIQDEEGVYNPEEATEGNPLPSGTAKTRTD